MSMPLTLPQAPRRSLVESAIDLIRAQVETGAWKLGERIPKEAELAEMLQVSRNTVREAVRVLSHANILEVRQGDGTYVRSNVDPSESRRTAEDVEQLSRLLEERGDIPESGDLTAFVDRDVAFHMGIAQAAHNSALEELYRYFAAASHANTHALLLELEQDAPGTDDASHARILAAIERRLPDEAAQAARDLMASITNRLAEIGEA
jgi:DNA-binding FadR family transcriptional regulator